MEPISAHLYRKNKNKKTDRVFVCICVFITTKNILFNFDKRDWVQQQQSHALSKRYGTIFILHSIELFYISPSLVIFFYSSDKIRNLNISYIYFGLVSFYLLQTIGNISFKIGYYFNHKIIRRYMKLNIKSLLEILYRIYENRLSTL